MSIRAIIEANAITPTEMNYFADYILEKLLHNWLQKIYQEEDSEQKFYMIMHRTKWDYGSDEELLDFIKSIR